MRLIPRLAFYASVAATIGMLILVPTSRITIWIIAGAAAYLSITIIALVVDALLLSRFTPKRTTLGVKTARLGSIITVVSVGGVILGILLMNAAIVQTSVFTTLLGIELHITRRDWAGES